MAFVLVLRNSAHMEYGCVPLERVSHNHHRFMALVLPT